MTLVGVEIFSETRNRSVKIAKLHISIPLPLIALKIPPKNPAKSNVTDFQLHHLIKTQHSSLGTTFWVCEDNGGFRVTHTAENVDPVKLSRVLIQAHCTEIVARCILLKY